MDLLLLETSKIWIRIRWPYNTIPIVKSNKDLVRQSNWKLAISLPLRATLLIISSRKYNLADPISIIRASEEGLSSNFLTPILAKNLFLENVHRAIYPPARRRERSHEATWYEAPLNESEIVGTWTSSPMKISRGRMRTLNPRFRRRFSPGNKVAGCSLSLDRITVFSWILRPFSKKENAIIRMWNRGRRTIESRRLGIGKETKRNVFESNKSRIEGRNRDEARVIDWSLSKESSLSPCSRERYDWRCI